MENEEEKWNGPKFSPPVYQQRYEAVAKIVKSKGARRVLDVGCSEAKFLTHLKYHCPAVETIIGIDIDKEILCLNKFRIKPLITEYLFKRTTKLQMALYEGSAIQPDVLFKGFDFLSCIEVIEHLTEESLACFPSAIFGVFRPSTVVITTPNADFNVLFPNFSGFRHHDHKFEWTRAEFQTWCFQCCAMYGYSVEFSCVGSGPKGTEDLGGCSQMAVFEIIPDFVVNESFVKSVKTSDYILISDAVYPCKPELSLPEKLSFELKYLIRKYFLRPDENDDDLSIRRIPLETIMAYHSIKELTTDIDLLRKVAGDIYNLSEDKRHIIVNYDHDDGDDDDDGSLDEEFESKEATKQDASMSSNDWCYVENTQEEFWE